MRELDFQIVGVESAANGLTPLLHFRLRITVTPGSERIQGLLLNTQIQIQSPQRIYSSVEKERLYDLFGPPDQWGQTLRNRLWAHANANVGPFDGNVETVLPVPCSYDLNLAAVKYFYALAEGDVPLLFLFSGSVFYATPEGRVSVERISWSKECVYRLPVRTWRDLMEKHYPNSAWLYLQRQCFDQLYAYKRRHGLATWEQTMERLLEHADEPVPIKAAGAAHAALRAGLQEAAA